MNYTVGYKALFCSNKCRCSKEGVKIWKEEAKKTCLERYGVELPFKSKKIQDKVNKTTLARYGNVRAKELEYKTNKERGTFNTSKIEEEAKN